ncbi:MAG: hypothetical protein GC159_11315 [Phycisphaera sp.]|nr:hypothetical protein [Phycisphaera sp.]
MTTHDITYTALISICGFFGVALFVYYGAAIIRDAWLRQEQRYDNVLNRQLLMDIPPRVAMMLTVMGVLGCGLVLGLFLASTFWFLIGAVIALALPPVVINHLEESRLRTLDEQIVDGITTLASGVRAGLNLVQSMQLLVRNGHGPIRQEFQQLMREYELGIDLSLAMQNAANRIGSSYYRLMFTAVQAHRDRGGDMGQSLDRIAEAIREIQRLEGKLKALTAQGRAQALFMSLMPFVIFFVLYLIDPTGASRLITEPMGRLLLLVAIVMIATGGMWIRRIMQVDI